VKQTTGWEAPAGARRLEGHEPADPNRLERIVLICTRTGRVLSPGQTIRVLTPGGFTEGVLDTVTLAGAIRVQAGSRVHDVPVDDVEALWRVR
jgi:hypothetical protein